jgi:HK97 family phage major capsid protein
MSAATVVKREEVQRLHRSGAAILEQYKAGLPADKAVELKAIKAEIDKRQAEIKLEEDAEVAASEFNNIDKWLNDPIRKVPHGVNGDNDDRKALLAAGWEFKGGYAYAPTSLGKTQEMFGEDVLFGPIPTNDPATAQFYNSTRAAMAPEYKAAYTRYIRLVATMPDSGMVYAALSGAEQKALSEGQDTAGGFTVPPDVQAELLMRTAQQAVMRRLARVQTTNRDILRWPMMKANATSGSIYSSGFVGGWAGETPSFSDTDPSFQMFDIPIKKIRVATKLSNDLIADSAFNILASLAQDGAQNMALVEDSGFITGDGAALQPLGLLNGGFTTFDVEGSTTDTISNTVSAAGSAPKIVAGVYLIPDQYVSGSVMLMSRTIEGKVAALVDGNGRPFWAPPVGSGFAAPPRMVEGLPVYNSSFMPSDGTNGNKVMFVGNIAQAYIIGQRAQVTSVVLRERFADTDQTGLILCSSGSAAPPGTSTPAVSGSSKRHYESRPAFRRVSRRQTMHHQAPSDSQLVSIDVPPRSLRRTSTGRSSTCRGGTAASTYSTSAP